MTKHINQKNGLLIIVLSLLILLSFFYFKKNGTKQKAITKFESFLLKEYRKVPRVDPEKRKEMEADEPEMAALQDYFMTLDPSTGTVPRERLRQAYRQTLDQQSLKSGDAPILWQGYSVDMGGRTRAIMYDPNDTQGKKVWAGGVTGGLWYNNNIQSATSSWVAVSDFWPCLSIRCITYDPNNTNIFYVGTGEVETARQTYRESSGLGDGIWTSSDGGQTWNQLMSTTGFAYVTKIVVRDENGSSVIYAGVASGLYQGTTHISQPSDGLFRSVDNGATWQQVLPDISGTTVPFAVSDIVVPQDGSRIIVGSRQNLAGKGGATILSSNTGLPGSWTVYDYWKLQIQNEPLYKIPGRVVLACAPSDPNVVFAVIASGFINPARYNFEDYYCRHMLQSNDKGSTWTRKGTPYIFSSGTDTNFANLAWHALDIAVDPNNKNTVYIGGLDVYKTTDDCVNWSHLSDWSLMYYGGGPDYIHADQHMILYKPGSSTEMVFGSDGGIFYTANGNVASPVFQERNHNYNTLQFYSAAIKSTAGSKYFLGGLQDNGSLRYTGTPLTINSMQSGGDGAYAFYDKDEPTISLSSIYYNQWYVFSNNNPINYVTDWYPSGVFVNPSDYDYRVNTLYANACDFSGNYVDNLLRITNISSSSYSGSMIPLNTGSQVYFSAVKWSPWSPSGQAHLFVGTQSGRLFKILNAQSTPTKTEITGSSFPTANISSIAIGGSEDTLLVTFSNYGIISVWQTYNGGQTWQNKEGNLPDMPIRWGLYHPQNYKQALLATEIGVWSTVNLDADTPVWVPVNDGMANVRVDMLTIRESDRTILAASHGRGLFTTTWDVVSGVNNNQYSVVSCYPNPTTGQLNINLGTVGSRTIEINIYDQTGKPVYREQNGSDFGMRIKRVDLSDQPAGIYLLRVLENNAVIKTEKIIKY